MRRLTQTWSLTLLGLALTLAPLLGEGRGRGDAWDARCLGALVSARTVRADPPAEAAPKQRDVFDALATRILPRADTVVVGTARVVREGVGGAATLVSVAVDEVLKGTADRTITVFISGPRNTADPSNPSAPWFPDTRPHRCALFLRAAPNGSGYGLETLFFADGPEGSEKVEVLAKEVRILSVADAPTRRREALAHLLDLVGGDRTWSRAHGAKELEVLVAVAPELFDAATRTELHAARRKTFAASTRAALSRVLSRLSLTAADDSPEGDVPAPPVVTPPADAPPADAQPLPAPTGMEPLSEEYLRARRRVGQLSDIDGRLAGLSELARLGRAAAGPDLLAAFAASEPLLRERAAVLLGDVGAVEAWPTLRAAFATERVPEVREALLRAGGLLGDAHTVPWVEAHLEDAALRTSALMALARLRTPAALAILAQRQEEALSASPPDEATARLLGYLRSPAFEAAERAVGRTVGPRRVGAISREAPQSPPPSAEPETPPSRPETPR